MAIKRQKIIDLFNSVMMSNQKFLVDDLVELFDGLAGKSPGELFKEEPFSFLHDCAMHDRADLLKYFLDSGVPVDHCTPPYNTTALKIAISAGSLECAALLMEYGADINLRLNMYDRAPIHQAIASGDINLIKFVVDQGADLTSKFNYVTPIRLAFRDKKKDVCRQLVEAGADPSELDWIPEQDFFEELMAIYENCSVASRVNKSMCGGEDGMDGFSL